MDTERMIHQLKREANKHRYDTLRTFDTNITALCSDVIPKLEHLKQYEAIGTVEECQEARWLEELLKENTRRAAVQYAEDGVDHRCLCRQREEGQSDD